MQWFDIRITGQIVYLYSREVHVSKVCRIIQKQSLFVALIGKKKTAKFQDPTPLGNTPTATPIFLKNSYRCLKNRLFR